MTLWKKALLLFLWGNLYLAFMAMAQNAPRPIVNMTALPGKIMVVPNNPPVARAGEDIELIDENKNGKEEVMLDGSASTDSDGKITSYVWKIGNEKVGEGATTKIVLITGQHTVTLILTDDRGDTASDELVVIIHEPANKAPVARAGEDQTVEGSDSEAEVQLDGTGSEDKDGSITGYSWSIDNKEIAAVSQPKVKLPVGTHVILLTVTDDKGLTSTDDVTITVKPPANQPPVAHAGEDIDVLDENDDGFEETQLNGTGSVDEDGHITDYSWKWELGSAHGIQPEVMLPVGITSVVLIVTDDQGGQSQDTVAVHVRPFNQPPQAQAGEDIFVEDKDRDGQETVTLDGSNSKDKDGIIASYAWTYQGLDDTIAGVHPTVTLPVGTTEIILTVKDNQGETATDTVVIAIQAKNEAPVADAGADQEVTDEDGDGKTDVNLDGSASRDTDGTISNYIWYNNEKKEIANGEKPVVTLALGVSNILLVVTDDRGATDTATVSITVMQALGVDRAQMAKENIMAFPNPASGQVIVISSTRIPSECYILNGQGKVLERGRIMNGKVTFDVSGYPAGIYHLMTASGGKRTTRKLIIY